jgi:hypothetical protein
LPGVARERRERLYELSIVRSAASRHESGRFIDRRQDLIERATGKCAQSSLHHRIQSVPQLLRGQHGDSKRDAARTESPLLVRQLRRLETGKPISV